MWNVYAYNTYKAYNNSTDISVYSRLNNRHEKHSPKFLQLLLLLN